MVRQVMRPDARSYDRANPTPSAIAIPQYIRVYVLCLFFEFK